MSTPLFRGVGVALVTLFNEDGAVEAKATADLALQLVELGVQAVLVAGSTGESPSLDANERVELITAVREVLPAGVPLLAGTGAQSGYQAARFTKEACDAGVDAVLTIPPNGTVDLMRYFTTVVAASSVPVLAYHFPAFALPGIPVSVLRTLPVDGVKDSSGDVDRLVDTLTTWDKPFYTGSAALLSHVGPLGGTGAMLAIANSQPELAIAAFAGDTAAQRELAPYHLDAKSSFPSAIKAQVGKRFGVSTVTRMG
jgi:4-hydroxy-tetrahydrodipicolinate synthase